MTIQAALLQILAQAKKPLTWAEILDELVKIRPGVNIASARTTLGVLLSERTAEMYCRYSLSREYVEKIEEETATVMRQNAE